MSTFHAWHLPPPFIVEEGSTHILDDEPYPSLRLPTLSPERLGELLAFLRSARDEELIRTPVRRIVEIVDRVARRFLDPGDTLRSEALSHLGPQAGFSSTMATRVLEGMARDWTRERLERLLAVELRDPEVLDGFRPGPEGGRVRALGYPVTFHLGAGSVPGVATTSLVRALLVKSAALLKPGRGDVVIPVLFARGIAEEDPAVGRSLAVAYWPGPGSPLTGEALRRADLVVVYGGDDTVRWVRERLPVTTPLRAYRHRMGFALVGRDAMRRGAAEVVREAALAVALFDQRGCVSPHFFLVEEGGEIDPREWGRMLGEALRAVEGELPSGTVTPEEAVAVQQFRGEGELRAALGRGAIHHGGSEAPWTVVVDADGDARLRISCLNRTVTVVAVRDLSAAPALLESWGDHLQTAAFTGLGSRASELAEALAKLGVTRLAPLRDVAWPPPWWHHDGSGALGALLRWTDWEGDSIPDDGGGRRPDPR